ncbi:hypothetical protein Pcinc_020993 [Petrolisthes cinctipes]|uniref:Uncharacterized protein n=1 Tax=Petrolisthes cinctipes TaxID=88211 RepID=A0AAE1KJ30_PETCI|nr:hypothetical protein Pcinc_020993 [Petrolisthes cinctipes]
MESKEEFGSVGEIIVPGQTPVKPRPQGGARSVHRPPPTPTQAFTTLVVLAKNDANTLRAATPYQLTRVVVPSGASASKRHLRLAPTGGTQRLHRLTINSKTKRRHTLHRLSE